MPQDILTQITLCTYSTGSEMVREVLDDWLEFLGGRPKRVIFAVSSSGAIPVIYETLRSEGKIDEILVIEAQGRSVLVIEPLAVRRAIEAAPTEWILLIKLDTLPYRSGHSDWLEKCMSEVQNRGFLGMTGSFRPDDARPIAPCYSSTQKYSNNFSIFRKKDWLQIIPAELVSGLDAIIDNVSYSMEDLRFAPEAAIEAHLRRTGNWMLTRNEDSDWSVFHVNVWGARLGQIRNRYRRREKLGPFLHTGVPPRFPLVHPWQWWYGTSPPSLLKRVRIWIGRKRRELRKVLYPKIL